MVDQAIEVLTGRERRRRWSTDEKLRIVAATFEPGACVRQVAASNDVYPGLVFTWRRQVREGRLGPATSPVFLPVRTTAPLPTLEPGPCGDANRGAPGRIEIELTNGTRVRVDADVSVASLRRVITALRG